MVDGLMPLNCSSSCLIHGLNGCNCIPSQGQQHHNEQSQLHQPKQPANVAILPFHLLACAAPTFATPYIHFPDLHGGGYGAVVYLQHHNQPSDSQLNVPSASPISFCTSC